MKKVKLKVDKFQLDIILNAIIEYRNQLVIEGKYDERVDELLFELCK